MTSVTRATAAWWTLFLVAAAASLPKLVNRATASYGDAWAYFQASRRLLAGADPYLPVDHWVYLYPPFWAFLVTPLAQLPAPLYAAVWGAILGVCWILSRTALRRLLLDAGEEPRPIWDLLPHLLIFRFALASWGAGQVTLLLLVILVTVLVRHREGRDLSAGALLGLAAAIKVFPAFLAILFARPGARRGALAFVVSLALLSILPALETGIDRFGSLVTGGFVGRALAACEAQKLWPGRCSPAVFLERRLGLESSATLIELAVALTVIFVTIAVRPSPAEDRGRLGLALALTGMLVATPMVAENWLTLLVVPYAAALRHASRRPPGDRARRVLLAGVALSAGVLNVHSPLIVGDTWSDTLQAAGCGPAGLLVIWVTLVIAVRITARPPAP